MKMYRTIKAVPVSAGTVVLLTDEQARRRRGRVEALGEGRYRLNELLAFKAGEVVGIEGALPKVHQELLEPVGAPVAEASVDLMPMGGGRKAKKGY